MMPFIFDESSFQSRNQISNLNQVGSSPAQYRSIRSSLMLGDTGGLGAIATRTDIAISPDGNLVAYTDNRGGATELRLKDIRYVDNDISLGIISRAGGVGLPKFSPDGEWIVFQDGSIR